MGTRTGNFPIGFRRGWSDWQRKSVGDLAKWAKINGFEALDLMNITPDDLKTLKEFGVRIGTVDLQGFGDIMHNDLGKRKEALDKNVAMIKTLGPAGVKVFFTCIIPGDASKPRGENYKLAVECYAPIAAACASVGANLAIEGWPGGAPHFANLCCTPETTRAFLKDVGAGCALNYDPSHLIRLGVDHLRFLREFLPHVKHVHGKDTAVLDEALYEFGSQSSAFEKPHGFGEWTWRYTIPGHGVARWDTIFATLKSGGFDGIVSVELEDENFNTGEEGEKAGLLHSLNYLRST